MGMKKNKNIARIALLTSVAIFSLMATTVGTYAWFLSKASYDAQIAQFAISNRNVSINSIRLLKFCYDGNDTEGYDYINPGSGEACAFPWNGTSFGPAQDPVDVMNIYDPYETDITGQPLIYFNCNAVFEITFESSDFSTGAIAISSAVKRALEDGTDYHSENNEILLSTCVDFDVFTPDDLLTSGPNANPAFYNTATGLYDNHKPSYLHRAFNDADEETYFKISYLSSLLSSHAHFYDSADNHVTIGDDDAIDFAYPDAPINEETPEAVIYINVNYAPNELTQYRDHVRSDINLRAVYDFYLSFTLM